MISMLAYYGGGVDSGDLSTNMPIKLGFGRCITINPIVPGLALTHESGLLPPYFMEGGPYFYIYNRNGANTVALRESDGTVYGSIAPNQVAEIYMYAKEATKARWHARVRNVAT